MIITKTGNINTRLMIYIQNIGTEFGIEKCAMLKMMNGKRQMMERKELQNHEKIKAPRKKITNTWEYWTPSNQKNYLNMSTGKKLYISVVILVKQEHEVYKAQIFTLNCPVGHIA